METVKTLKMKKAADMSAAEWKKRRYWRWRAAWMDAFDSMGADQLSALFTALTGGDAIALFIDKAAMRETLHRDIADGAFDAAWMSLHDGDRKALLERANLPNSNPSLVTRTLTVFNACRDRDAQFAAELAH
jgi:hypothetical protein